MRCMHAVVTVMSCTLPDTSFLPMSIPTHRQGAGCVLTLSGFSRSAIAVPSARNSGLLRISKWTDGSEQFLLSTCSHTNQCECTNSQHRSCAHLFYQLPTIIQTAASSIKLLQASRRGQQNRHVSSKQEWLYLFNSLSSLDWYS